MSILSCKYLSPRTNDCGKKRINTQIFCYVFLNWTLRLRYQQNLHIFKLLTCLIWWKHMTNISALSLLATWVLFGFALQRLNTNKPTKAFRGVETCKQIDIWKTNHGHQYVHNMSLEVIPYRVEWVTIARNQMIWNQWNKCLPKLLDSGFQPK